MESIICRSVWECQVVVQLPGRGDHAGRKRHMTPWAKVDKTVMPTKWNQVKLLSFREAVPSCWGLMRFLSFREVV
jgi:hypothetical protein